MNPEAPFDDLPKWPPDPPDDQFAFRIAGMVVALIIVILLLSISIMAFSAQAHMHDRPDLDDWFGRLRSQGGNPCCDAVEGSSISDIDWKMLDTEKCEKSFGQQDQPSHYCVRLDKKWWLVPDKSVIIDPNRYGPAVVWIYWSNPGPDEVPYIRCFLPGAGG